MNLYYSFKNYGFQLHLPSQYLILTKKCCLKDCVHRKSEHRLSPIIQIGLRYLKIFLSSTKTEKTRRASCVGTGGGPGRTLIEHWLPKCIASSQREGAACEPGVEPKAARGQSSPERCDLTKHPGTHMCPET